MNKRIIHSVFENQVTKTPHCTAVVQGAKRVSYHSLNQNANLLANLLRDMSIKREQTACAFLPAGVDHTVSLLGIFKSGGIYMPLDLGLSQKRIQQALLDSKSNFCITDLTWCETVKNIFTKISHQIKYLIVLDGDIIEVLSVDEDYKNITDQWTLRSENPSLVNDPEDGNYLFYTSGSTGDAKAILGKHDSLSHCIHWEMKEFEVTSNFRVSQLSQSTFDASLRDILVPLCAGGTLCIPTSETKDNLMSLVTWIVEQKITLLHTVPSVFRTFIKEWQANEGLAPKVGVHLKHVLLAGEPLYAKDINSWRKVIGRSSEVVNLYGATEATMFKTFHRIDHIPDSLNAPLHAGKPISNALVAIINDGRLCSKGEIGEIYIITPFLSKGYFNNEQKTKESFVQNPLVTDRNEIVYKTGDFGRYLNDANIEVLGRRDDQVKINGIRVELNEIKEAVLSYESIEETELIVHQGEDLENTLICYYVGRNVQENELSTYLESILNRSILPSSYVKMEEFPLTINGKVDKRALPTPENFLIKESEYEATIGATESSLELMCLDILGLSRMGRKVSFFKVGGTSLKAMQYISRIHQKYDVSINLRDVFEQNTIEKLAAHLENLIDLGEGYKTIPKLKHRPDYEMSHAQKRLWLVDQYEGEKLKYNMSYASRIHGDFKLNVFQKVINQLVERHEILRTTFDLINGMPRQIVHETNGHVLIQNNDVRNSQHKQVLISKLINDELHTAFDLSQGPLFRARVVQAEDDEFIMVLSMHHIVADGWSVEVIHKECFALYHAILSDEDNPLTPLRIQYKDFSHWQNSLLEEKNANNIERYWLNQLSGDLKAIEIPTDYADPDSISANGDYLSFEMDDTLAQQVQSLAEENDATGFMVMTALTNLLLAKYSGFNEIITGTPTAARKHPELEGQVGVYINVLPLRVKSVLQQPNFKALLKEVRQVIIEAFENDLYPFDLLIEKLGLVDSRSRFPLINVLIQSQDMFTNHVTEVEGLTVTDVDAKCMTSKVDLTFNFKLEEGKALCAIEYNTSLFSPDTIHNIKENFLHLAQVVTANQEISMANVELLLDAQKEQEQEEFLNSMMDV